MRLVAETGETVRHAVYDVTFRSGRHASKEMRAQEEVPVEEDAPDVHRIVRRIASEWLWCPKNQRRSSYCFSD